MKTPYHLFILWIIIIHSILAEADEVTIFRPPVTSSYLKIDPDSAVIVSGRKVTPSGKFILTQSYNWGMSISKNEKKAVLVSRDAIEVITLDDPMHVENIPAEGKSSYLGCIILSDGKTLFYGAANEGKINIFDLETKKASGTIDINQDGYKDSLAGDFVVSPDEKFLYAVDQFNFRLVKIDLASRKVVQSLSVGRHPFRVKLSQDGMTAWVCNVGLYEYPLVPGTTKKNEGTNGLPFPPYGVPSKEAEDGVQISGKLIPGLGSPNHPDAMSIFKVNLDTWKVESKIKTGYLVGVDRDGVTTVGGASPCSMAIGKHFVYVSNATNDTISIIDAETGSLVGQIPLLVPKLEKLRGVLPFGICLSPDESSLYVACAGLNAIAVVDLEKRELRGYIPAGWFCSAVEVSNDGKTIYASSAKGLGSGPNGGVGIPPSRSLHPASIMQGTFQIIEAPSHEELDAYTKKVIANTYTISAEKDDGKNPLPLFSGIRKSPIEHIVFIVKENRTFDQVFGKRAGVVSPEMCGVPELGLHVSIKKSKDHQGLDDVDITPNHHALADQFAISDNFYCNSDQSNVGHRWVVGVYPNEWVEVNAVSKLSRDPYSSAPGRRNVAGSSVTILPEDYNEAGALWEHLDRNQVSFFNFGFGNEMPGALERQVDKETGIRMPVVFPLPRPLFEHTSRIFPTYNLAIPDQYRVDMFEEEFRTRWETGKEPFPKLITMVLPNDHMTQPHPNDGYPFKESYMADNDLALARVIHKLSNSVFWKKMLVIVVEDDPQGGRDHIDAHRSILMMMGPFVKKGYISHTLMDFGAVMKVIFTILDLPPLNQFDAVANLPQDFFTDEPLNVKPYKIRPSDPRLFDPSKVLKPFDHGFNWKGLLDSEEMDELEQMRKNYKE